VEVEAIDLKSLEEEC